MICRNLRVACLSCNARHGRIVISDPTTVNCSGEPGGKCLSFVEGRRFKTKADLVAEVARLRAELRRSSEVQA